MTKKTFVPEHLNATAADLAGNDDIGRYVFIPGSDGRAKEIASHFNDLKVQSHPRGHHLYLGTLVCNGKEIAVAAISSGMGCPSMEIIIHELFHLGAKRFLRIGTGGSMQPDNVKVGHLVNAKASVRDESTTRNYVPIEYPAVASLEMTSAILIAAERINLDENLHTGIVHCKSSLYAREFGAGPERKENQEYVDLLSRAGVLVTEMETATLFIQSQIYTHQLSKQEADPQHQVLAGAIISVVDSLTDKSKNATLRTKVLKDSIRLGIETIKTLAMQELFE